MRTRARTRRRRRPRRPPCLHRRPAALRPRRRHALLCPRPRCPLRSRGRGGRTVPGAAHPPPPAAEGRQGGRRGVRAGALPRGGEQSARHERGGVGARPGGGDGDGRVDIVCAPVCVRTAVAREPRVRAVAARPRAGGAAAAAGPGRGAVGCTGGADEAGVDLSTSAASDDPTTRPTRTAVHLPTSTLPLSTTDRPTPPPIRP
ncbi:hypothetical protein K438DRAFT_344079 [Mycena galopus ATCC 62051]|nr:hypothetical protein K438DRAFT_344079 [Mycena galopus ATCC 62051]